MPALVTQTSARKITVIGRLNSPVIIKLFCEGSFDHPVINPWEALLGSTSSPNNLRVGLQQSWSHLTSTFQDVATPEVLLDEGLLLNQPNSSAGFYADGSRANSVTDTITRELEGERLRALGVTMETNLARGDYKLWSWTAWTTKFLHAPPDAFGLLEDNIFQVALATFLGQLCPVLASNCLSRN